MNGQIVMKDGEDFVHSLNKGQAKAVILDPSEAMGAISILEPKWRVDENRKLSFPDIPSLDMIVPFDVRRDGSQKIASPLNGIEKSLSLDDLKAGTETVAADLKPDDVCAYMCTSGSTGFFKLVEFNHERLLEYGHRFAETLEMKETDIYCNDRPLGWMGGYPVMYVATGCTRVCTDNSLGRHHNYPDFMLDLLVREGCTKMYTVPHSLGALVREAAKKDIGGYRLHICGVGSGPVSRAHMKAIGVVADAVLAVYGCTEAGIPTTKKVTEPSAYEDMCVGLPTSGTQVKVVDDDLRELPNGQRGEILLKTSQSSMRYVNADASTRETFLDHGWIRLGDSGVKNDGGELFVVGRKKFAILRGPFVIYPDQMEQRILQCPGVAGAAVAGVPDPVLHEELCACVIREQGASLTEEELRGFCQKLFINSENGELNPMPGYFLFLDALPFNVSGKLDRMALKAKAKSMLRL
ncbi:3-[(3aS,4S,7aS)-7a-methyl-1,5-dioxo-octahydro-1H-inden-4-yl]propanoyl:CoA ligase-like [Aplysia californica]|uniref:Medium-chain acyl-CoA ligase ACSF2, mitochondrial n=1 Tax=Aplysia californica TaxID=6500 RepID=A0ABM0K239_APLCA|nr:3-[(3aS,4S,7aS)-7a-methyl-1,5-dioxo-octahydro-1H-inden-4-yl]propanoyl:CoA ligase-like [Aplysia californica]